MATINFNWSNLQEYLVTKAPPAAYYIPSFISKDEEEYLLRHIYEAPKPKWTTLKMRRLQDYGGIPHKNGLIPDTIPTWLQSYMDRVSDIGVFGQRESVNLSANHCLINEYTAGQGIMPHLDGPLFTPIITTISCGSHTLLEFSENNESRNLHFKLLLEPCSLLILKGDLYTHYFHSISATSSDVIDETIANLERTSANVGDILERGTRVSLTIRNVPRVMKAKLLNNLYRK